MLSHRAQINNSISELLNTERSQTHSHSPSHSVSPRLSLCFIGQATPLESCQSESVAGTSPARRQSGSCPILARRLSGAKTDCRSNGDVVGGKMFNPSRTCFSVFSDYKMAAGWLTLLHCLKKKRFYRRARY